MVWALKGGQLMIMMLQGDQLYFHDISGRQPNSNTFLSNNFSKWKIILTAFQIMIRKCQVQVLDTRTKHVVRHHRSNSNCVAWETRVMSKFLQWLWTIILVQWTISPILWPHWSPYQLKYPHLVELVCPQMWMAWCHPWLNVCLSMHEHLSHLKFVAKAVYKTWVWSLDARLHMTFQTKYSEPGLSIDFQTLEYHLIESPILSIVHMLAW